MRRRDKLPELLAPAGDMECLYAAVKAGADAIYVGGRLFGARAFAKNFDIEELEYAVGYCHLHGVKLYVTVNTLVYDKELSAVSDFAAELSKIGVDAVIVQDLGVAREIKRRAPKLPIHASTQMSIHSTAGADAAFRLGCERVVLARELSLENILSVTEKSLPEIEIFLHGALCVSYSGQCLFSSLVGGRSGNRGECAQPCRLPYNDKYPLSLSDLSLAEHIPELIASGVSSLKIEGRMKSSDYVYTVTSIYRRLLDEGRRATPEENKKLRAAFSRGEFTDGYFKNTKFKKMTGVRTDSDKDATNELQKNKFDAERVPIRAEAEILLGKPSKLTLVYKDRRVTSYGDSAVLAINSPLTEESVKNRLSKMGGTFFTLDEKDVTLKLDSGVNLPPSAINALRRDAVSLLSSHRREGASREYEPEEVDRNTARPLFTAEFFSKESFVKAYSENNDAFADFDVLFLPLYDYDTRANGVYIPPVVTDSEEKEIMRLLKKAKENGAEYALVSNVGHIEYALASELIPIGSYRLNVTNRLAKKTLRELGINDTLLSLELTLPMAKSIGGGLAVYGRLPLMLTERCFIKENFGCDKCGKAAFTDRKGSRFPMRFEYGHRNIIFNSVPTYMGDRKEELEAAKISHAHMLFAFETADEILNAINSYKDGRALSNPIRRIGKR